MLINCNDNITQLYRILSSFFFIQLTGKECVVGTGSRPREILISCFQDKLSFRELPINERGSGSTSTGRGGREGGLTPALV